MIGCRGNYHHHFWWHWIHSIGLWQFFWLASESVGL
jgi:hypothetical protein